ncbi:MAG: porin family protein [Rhodospirillales bacterium]|nr:porin family protein [Rhodospirillales bacterium]
MNTIKTSCLAAAVLVSGALVSAPVSAQMYASGSLGLFSPNDSTARGNGFSGSAQLDNGIDAAAALGFRFTPNIRAEGEFGYAHTRLNKITVNGVGSAAVTGGDVDLYTFTANAYYDFTNSSIYTPYLGGGLGLAHQELSSGSAAGVSFTSGSSNNFMWQLEAGVSIAISPSLSVVPAYRYARISDGGTSGGVTSDDSEGNIFKIGLRYKF